MVCTIWYIVCRTQKKEHGHTGTRFLKSPLLLGFFVPRWLCGSESIMQNKPNVKIGKINISTAIIKAYAKKQRTMTNERYPKQTQSKPISNSQTLQCCEKSHPTGLYVRRAAHRRIATLPEGRCVRSGFQELRTPAVGRRACHSSKQSARLLRQQ